MEEIEIKREKEEEGETIYEHREFNIKNETGEYILRLEINEKDITILISSNNNIEYNYKTQMSLLTIVNKLELNSAKYCNLELILKLFDKIYETNSLVINVNNNDNDYCILIIKLINASEEKNYEIKLYKHYMKYNDKFNMLYNQFKLAKNTNNNNINMDEINKKFEELNNKIEQKEKEIQKIKDTINTKDNVINEMNKKIQDNEDRIKNHINRINDYEDKIRDHERRIKDLVMRNKNIFNENQILNRLFKKHKDEAEIINNQISNYFNNINENLITINEITADVNKLKKNLNILNKKIEDEENNDRAKRKNDEKTINKINNEINRIMNYINHLMHYHNE